MSKTQVCIQMPKTASSIRIIPLADGLTDLLRAHRKSPEKYLIPGRKREWVDIRTLQYRFSSILKNAGFSPFISICSGTLSQADVWSWDVTSRASARFWDTAAYRSQ